LNNLFCRFMRWVSFLLFFLFYPCHLSAQSLDQQYKQQNTDKRNAYAKCLSQWKAAQIRQDEWNRYFQQGNTLTMISNGGGGCNNRYKYPLGKAFVSQGLQLMFKSEGDNLYKYIRMPTGHVSKEWAGTYRKVEFNGVFDQGSNTSKPVQPYNPYQR
jgi:hypothetical protein